MPCRGTESLSGQDGINLLMVETFGGLVLLEPNQRANNPIGEKYPRKAMEYEVEPIHASHSYGATSNPSNFTHDMRLWKKRR